LKILNDEVKALSGNDQLTFFDLLKQRIITEPNKQRNYNLFIMALENGFDYKPKFLEALNSIGGKIPPSARESLKNLTKTHSEFNTYTENKQKRKA
jgi:hypothetical protein